LPQEQVLEHERLAATERSAQRADEEQHPVEHGTMVAHDTDPTPHGVLALHRERHFRADGQTGHIRGADRRRPRHGGGVRAQRPRPGAHQTPLDGVRMVAVTRPLPWGRGTVTRVTPERPPVTLPTQRARVTPVARWTTQVARPATVRGLWT